MLETPANILLVVIGIGFLIFIHEFGHFIMAKKVGVRVFVFSLGFGPALLKRKFGETEYRLSAIPLGGYVKLAGELPSEKNAGENWELMSKTVGQRAMVFVAGVVLNAALAFVAFIAAFSIGVPFETSEIGMVSPGKPAWEAGLMPGDKIVKIKNTSDPDFEDVHISIALSSSPDGIPLTIDREGERFDVVVYPEYSERHGYQIIGIRPAASLVIDKIYAYKNGPSPAEEAGLQVDDTIIAVNGKRISSVDELLEAEAIHAEEGLILTVLRDETPIDLKVTPVPTLWKLGLSCAEPKIDAIKRDSIAYAIGLRKNDEIIAVDNKNITVWAEIKDRVEDAAEKTISLSVKRDGQVRTVELPVDDAQAKGNFLDGIFPLLGLTVDMVVDGYPAKEIGLRPGDQLVSIDGKKLEDWEDLLYTIRGSDGTEMEMTWKRGTETITKKILPKKTGGSIGIALRDKKIMRQYGFFAACWVGSAKAITNVKMIYLTIKGLITKRLSSKTLGGIILIAQASYQSAQVGIGKLLYFIGILSLNLAILNILPIPVLDGGHLLFLGIEKLKGSPVSERTFAIAHYIGFALIITLILYATRNDIIRIIEIFKYRGAL
ncbi:MAG: RIP metalloprotease RseP [Candidatus Brocadiales bacterium]